MFFKVPPVAINKFVRILLTVPSELFGGNS